MTRAETVHLTLAFLGDVDGELVPDLKGIAVRGMRHELPIKQAVYRDRNRIVWVGPSEIPEELEFVVSNLQERLRERKFQTEKRAFAAHVTLIRKAREPRVLPPLPAVLWPVEEIVLVRSQLSAGGSRYERLASFALT